MAIAHKYRFLDKNFRIQYSVAHPLSTDWFYASHIFNGICRRNPIKLKASVHYIRVAEQFEFFFHLSYGILQPKTRKNQKQRLQIALHFETKQKN